MNEDKIRKKVLEWGTRRPSILGDLNSRPDESVLDIRPFEPIDSGRAGQIDVAVLDNSLCFEHHPEARLSQIAKVLQPAGKLIIGDVVRLRSLPSDLDNKELLWTHGMAGASMHAQYEAMLNEAGFVIEKQLSVFRDIHQLIEAYDSLADMKRFIKTYSRQISEPEWIASTQACCGMHSPDEVLAELLKCDNVDLLWKTIAIQASLKKHPF